MKKKKKILEISEVTLSFFFQTVWAFSVTQGCVYGAGSPSVMVWWTVPISVMKSIVVKEYSQKKKRLLLFVY